MPRGRRDARYTKRLAAGDRVGRRYVQSDKVRIEWHEDGHRRMRTVGENSRANRARADTLLQDILRGLDTRKSEQSMTDRVETDQPENAVRRWILRMMDVADGFAEGIRGTEPDAGDDAASDDSADGPDAEIVEDDASDENRGDGAADDSSDASSSDEGEEARTES